MKEGSLVVMVANLPDGDRVFLSTNNIPYPMKSDNIYVVSDIEEATSFSGKDSVFVYLEEYPLLTHLGMGMDISLFREVQGPEEISISAIMESVEEKEFQLT